MDIYIFRHGQSTYNVMGRTQGHTNNSELSEMGIKQAVEIGQKLKDKNIEIIISSPLKRAMQTANYANQSLNVNIIEDNHFIEVDIGDGEGLHYTEIQAKYGDFYHKWKNDETALDISYPNGETKREVRTRLFKGLDNYIKQNKYKSFAISGHGIILTQALLQLGSKDVEVKNGAIIHLNHDGNKLSFVGFI